MQTEKGHMKARSNPEQSPSHKRFNHGSYRTHRKFHPSSILMHGYLKTKFDNLILAWILLKYLVEQVSGFRLRGHIDAHCDSEARFDSVVTKIAAR